MNNKNFFIIILLIGALFIPQSAYSFYTGKTEQANQEFSPTPLIVKLKKEVDKKVSLGKVGGNVTTGIAKLDELNAKFSVQKQEKLFGQFKETALKADKFKSVYILEVPQETDLSQMKKEYEQRPEVEYAELDYKLELFEEQPNDPLFAHQWYLNNLGTAQNGGQGYYGMDRSDPYNHKLVMKFGISDADIDALEAFQRNDPTVPILVGIIDTGVDLDHEDLQSNIWTNPGEIPNNGIDDDHNGFVDDFYGWDFSGDEDEIIEDNDPTDTYGHGTHCAGIVAGVRNNALGVSGINTPCKIMAIKFFPWSFMSVAAKSIIYAADMGCNVINMSWGADSPSKVLEDALDYAVSKGVLPIAAAGNSAQEGNPTLWPAAYEAVFTVGASNSKDEVTYFSSYGEHVEVVAPGEDILSLRADSTDMYRGSCSGGTCPGPTEHIIPYPDGHYYLADGTSMASPCAVGVAAYIMSASPGISNDRVVEIMEQSADDIIYPYGGDSLYSPGKDIYSGYGRVNLNSALGLLLSGRIAEIDYPYQNALVSGEVAIIGTASGDNFQSYTLEYGEGISPQTWTEIVNSDVPVTDDTLGIWNSSGLVGIYTIRLTVGDQNQAVVRVIAVNGTDVRITSPIEGDTIVGVAQVRGYTIVPDFSSYILEYKREEPSSSWRTIITSTKMVADGGILDEWVVSNLKRDNYTLRLTVETNSGETYVDSLIVYVKSIVSNSWSQELSAGGSLSPAVGDINGDGYDEVVVGVGGSEGGTLAGGIEVFTHNGEREAGWPKDTDLNMMSSPALGDLDKDGINDIVICSEQQGVHAYLSSSPGWVRKVYTGGNILWSLATPIIADLENDGYLEVLTVNRQGTVYAWSGDGQPVIPGKGGIFAQASPADGGMDFPCLAVADLDGDGENEVIAGAATTHSGYFGHYEYGGGGIYIWDINGNPLLQPGDYPDKFVWIYGIAIANIDANPDLEIIVFGQNEDHNILSAFKKDGTQLSGYPIILEDLVAGWWFGNHPAVGDLDGDGTLEIVVSVWTLFSDARIYAWHQNGTPLNTSGPLVSFESSDSEKRKGVLSTLGSNAGEVLAKLNSMSEEELNGLISTFQDTVFATASETFGSPVLADVNNDGKVDIIARAGYFMGSGREKVFAWDYEGNRIPGWPIYAPSRNRIVTFYPYTPVMTNLDKNDKLDMVLVTQNNIFDTPKLVSWELDTDYDSTTMPWPKYMHDRWNSGRYGLNLAEGEIPNIPPFNFHVESWDESDVTLAWNPRVSWLSLGYNIYRTTISGEPGEKINTDLIPQAESTYQDLGLTFGQTYYYTITNVDTSHQESDRSKEVRVTIGQPSIPTGLVAQKEGQGRDSCDIRLDWLPNPPEDNIIKYNIYRKVPRDTGYIFIDSVLTDTTYLDTNITKVGIHSYEITAVNQLDMEGFASEPGSVDFQVSMGGGYTEVKIIGYTNNSILFEVRSHRGNPVHAYNIYRSTNSGEYYNPPINSTPIEAKYWSDGNPYGDYGTYGRYTYYYPTGLDGEYFFNATCIRTSGYPCDDTFEFKMDATKEISFIIGTPQAPTGLLATLNDSCNVVLSWKPNPEGDVVKYRIYHKITGSSFQVKDSVFAPETTYMDTSINDTLQHCYALVAIDSVGLESPESPQACASSIKPDSPWDIQLGPGTSGNSATIIWSNYYKGGGDIIGCNIYRSLVSHNYAGLEPINDTLIVPGSNGLFEYTDSNLSEGTTYYYTVTNVNKCGLESERCPCYPYYGCLEVSVLVGQPHKPSLEVRSGKKNIKLHISSFDADLKGYKIFRQENNGPFQVINPLHPDTVYIDTTAVVEKSYHYKASAIDTLNLESLPSNSAEGVIMLFNQGILLVDMTEGYFGVNTDSVNAFYQRVLAGYDYTYVDHSSGYDPPALTLLELSTHPIAVVHSEDVYAQNSLNWYFTYPVLKQYLDAGGALLIEGRVNLSGGWIEYGSDDYELRHFDSGDLQHDYLNVDSAYLPFWAPVFQRTKEFIGANRTPQIDGYPQAVELDTFRVNHAYDPKDYGLNGKLPGVGYFMPLDSSEVIYTFISAYDTSESNGKAVALKHITDEYAVIYFDFPLWFVKEDIATEILHKALADLEGFVSDTIVPPEDLANASVFPNPFKPFKGHTVLTFDGLTAQVKIEIFTIMGERVCTIEEKEGNGKLSWNVTNSQGRKLSSGIYIYRITNNQAQEKISKFAIIR